MTCGPRTADTARGASGKTGCTRREPAVFARHVVRLGGHRTERRTADDELRAAETNEIRQVRVTAGKLRDLHLGGEVEARDRGSADASGDMLASAVQSSRSVGRTSRVSPDAQRG